MKMRGFLFRGVSMRKALDLISPQSFRIGPGRAQKRQRLVSEANDMTRQQKRKLQRENEKRHR